MVPNFLKIALLTLSLASPAMADELDGYLQRNIRISLKAAVAGAVVEVAAAPDRGGVEVVVRTAVVGGELSPGMRLNLRTATFVAGDLLPHNQLLVFFRRSADGARLVPTARYELVDNGLIRQIPASDYLTETQAQAQQMPSRPRSRTGRVDARSVAHVSPAIANR
jgi:hypothetical protein